MKSEIRRFGILRAGKVCAILYGIFGLVLLPVGVIAALVEPFTGIAFLLMAVCYPLMGFVAGALFAGLYNLTARIGGGLRIELAQVQEDDRPARPEDIQLKPSPGAPPQEKGGSGDDRTYAPPGYYD